MWMLYRVRILAQKYFICLRASGLPWKKGIHKSLNQCWRWTLVKESEKKYWQWSTTLVSMTCLFYDFLCWQAMCRMCEMLHADPVPQNYHQMGEWWENNTCKLVVRYVNPFLFIRGLSCPSCIQASLSLNCLKLTIPGFPHNCLLASCGEIGFLKEDLGLILVTKSCPKVPFLPLGRFCPLQTILLSDLVGCDSPLRILMAFWHTIIVSRGLSHPTQKVWIQTKRAPNCHYYLQRAVTPKWMGSTALW